MKMVEVIVTDTVSGVAPVVPYSHEKGLQFYVTSTGVRTNRPGRARPRKSQPARS